MSNQSVVGSFVSQVNQNAGITAICIKEDFLDPSICDEIVKNHIDTEFVRGQTMDKDSENKRRVNVHRYIENEQINLYARVTETIMGMNNDVFHVGLLGIPQYDPINFFTYLGTSEDKYDWHYDVGPEHFSTRKLSFSIQLSNEDDYKGGDLEFLPALKTDQNPRKKGCIIVFPSYLTHRVSTVTEGMRNSLVGWVHGHAYF